MDLSQFAIDPNEPIPFPIKAHNYSDINEDPQQLYLSTLKSIGQNVTKAHVKIPSIFNSQEIKDHPYLHLFPGLQALVNFTRDDNTPPRPYTPIKHHPYLDHAHMSSLSDYEDIETQIFQPLNGIEQFLFNPWYQPINSLLANGTAHFSTGLSYYTWGPHYFGKNSTKGVLSKGIANTLAAAVHPGIEYKPIPISTIDDGLATDWTFEQYLRTPIEEFYFTTLEEGSRTRPSKAFRTPTTRWEFVHPKLPIIRVTSYNTVVLPFVDRDERPSIDRPARLWKFYKEHNNDRRFEKFCEAIDLNKLPREAKEEYNKKHCPRYPALGISTEFLVHLLKAAPPKHFDILFPQEELDPYSTTTFAVSFVIAFQNRWDSFTNPDRWLIRFHDDLMPRPFHPYFYKPFEPWQGAIEPKLDAAHFPNYWHTTDYMQHSIIGPVVVQVYESETLQPGIYNFTPAVTKWEAPEYIVPDDRQLIVRAKIYRELQPGQPFLFEGFTDRWLAPVPTNPMYGSKIGDMTITIGGLRLDPTPYSPNPGFPLPGHVMTAADSAPGTDIWELFHMDDNNW